MNQDLSKTVHFGDHGDTPATVVSNLEPNSSCDQSQPSPIMQRRFNLQNSKSNEKKT